MAIVHVFKGFPGREDSVILEDGTTVTFDEFMDQTPDFVMPADAVRCEYVAGQRLSFFRSDGTQFGLPCKPHEERVKWRQCPEIDALHANAGKMQALRNKAEMKKGKIPVVRP